MRRHVKRCENCELCFSGKCLPMGLLNAPVSSTFKQIRKLVIIRSILRFFTMFEKATLLSEELGLRKRAWSPSPVLLGIKVSEKYLPGLGTSFLQRHS